MGGRAAAQRSSWSSSSARQVILHLRACNSPREFMLLHFQKFPVCLQLTAFAPF
jgi:hypothetical protein